ncbi:MAG: PDZ domain-containing protein [Planctomycetota bacterium]
MRLGLLLAALFAGACSFTGRLPRESPPLADLEEPLALHEVPDDEVLRMELPPGSFTGVYATDARTELEEMDEGPEGIRVAKVVENSPGEAAGLEEGDLLLEVEWDGGSQVLRWASEWREVELTSPPGRRLRVVYDRAGAEREADLATVPRVRPAARGEVQRFREEQRVGIVVRTATEVESRAAGLGPGAGAVVVGLARGSPWRQAGLRFGDLLVEAGGQKVAHPQVVLDTIRQAPAQGKVHLRYVRDGALHELEAPVSRRAREMKRISIPLLYGYTKQGDFKRIWFFFGFYKHTRSSAAWETRLFWLFKFRGGDADRIEEIDP